MTLQQTGSKASKVLLIDVDSKLPNLALMKLSAWYRAQGAEVGFNVTDPDLILASVVFKRNKARALGMTKLYPGIPVQLGGTGYDLKTSLPEEVERIRPDYSIYPGLNYSMGFTTRGCIRRCPFCVVPEKEGRLTRWQHPSEFHNPAFKEIMLLDNNWLADREWFFETSDWIISQGLKVREHGMDIRLIDDELAAQLARMKWAAPLHFAYDSEAITESVEQGIDCLVRNGINVRQNVRFYVYVDSDQDYDSGVRRCRWLKAHNTTPFVMFNIDRPRTERIKHLQRWANLAWIFRSCDIDQYGVA